MSVIQNKIDELKNQLAEQVFTDKDQLEIEDAVAQYKKELIEEKKAEIENNKNIIQVQIDVLEEVRAEEIEQEKNINNLANISSEGQNLL